MKAIIKWFISILFLVLLAIAAIVAVIKTILVITFVFTWEQADEMHGKTMGKIVKFMKWVRGGDK